MQGLADRHTGTYYLIEWCQACRPRCAQRTPRTNPQFGGSVHCTVVRQKWVVNLSSHNKTLYNILSTRRTLAKHTRTCSRIRCTPANTHARGLPNNDCCSGLCSRPDLCTTLPHMMVGCLLDNPTRGSTTGFPVATTRGGPLGRRQKTSPAKPRPTMAKPPVVAVIVMPISAVGNGESGDGGGSGGEGGDIGTGGGECGDLTSSNAGGELGETSVS